MGTLEVIVAGSWSLGIVKESRMRADIDYGETERVGVREETVIRNPGGGKPASHGRKVVLLSQMYLVEA